MTNLERIEKVKENNQYLLEKSKKEINNVL